MTVKTYDRPAEWVEIVSAGYPLFSAYAARHGQDRDTAVRQCVG